MKIIRDQQKDKRDYENHYVKLLIAFFLFFTGDLPVITAQVNFLRSWRPTRAKRKDVPTAHTKPSVHMFYWQEEATHRELVIPLGSYANYSRATQPLAQRDNKQRTKPPVSLNLTAASGRTGSSRHTASVSHRFQGSQKTPQVKRGSCAVVWKEAFKKKNWFLSKRWDSLISKDVITHE